MVVVVFLGASVVVVVDGFLSFFGPESFFDLPSSGWTVVVVVEGSVGGGGAVLVVGAGGAAASTKVPADTPGRGSVLAGGVGTEEDDVDPAEGLAGSTPIGGDGGGAVVPGVAGSACSAGPGTDRAA